jgi:two-component system LytT family response regulator
MAETVKCIIVDDEPVARDVLENLLSRIDNIRVVASCRNAVEAFRAINEQSVDLVFLDINMPEISGLSFAKSMSRDLKIIFTTAYREYAVDGFDLMAVDYLLKPISFERLLQAINKYFDERTVRITKVTEGSAEEPEDFIFVRSDRKMVKVNFQDIRMVESLGDYLKIHMDGDRVLVTRETISTLEARLPHRDFLRVHRSFIVSVHKIESFTSEIVTIGSQEIPISRSHREEVMKRLGDF